MVTNMLRSLKHVQGKQFIVPSMRIVIKTLLVHSKFIIICTERDFNDFVNSFYLKSLLSPFRHTHMHTIKHF